LAAVGGLLCDDRFTGPLFVLPVPLMQKRTGPAPRPDAFLATVFQFIALDGRL
jgi:hypothetical protein